MVTPLRFMLHFSGTQVFDQRRRVERELLHTVPDDHSGRARLHAIHAASLLFSDPSAAVQAAAESFTHAEQAKDPISRAWALLAESTVELSCASTEKRRDSLRRVLATAAREDDAVELAEPAFLLYLAALAELGDIEEIDRTLSPVGPVLSQFTWLEQGRHVLWFRCLQATLLGRVEAAETLAHQGHAVALSEADPDAHTVLFGQLGVIRWVQGREVELEPTFLQARQSAPHEPIWAVCLAWIWIKQGRRSAARGLVSSLGDIAHLPIDRNWLSTVCILAEVVSELGETHLIHQVYDALLPYEQRLATIGLGVTCWGTVARPLALTAAALGRTDIAINHYYTAIDVAARTGSHPWLAESQWQLAQLLDRRANRGDQEEAVALASEAQATGRALRLHGLERIAAGVLSNLTQSATSNHDHSPATPPARPRVCLLDGFRVFSAEGEIAQWQSRKARQLVKILAARRGTLMSKETLMDVLWPGEAPHRLANRFSVAATAVRRAFDPAGTQPRHSFLENRDGLVRLRLENIDVDTEIFLQSAHHVITSDSDHAHRRAELEAVLALYTGEALHDEQEEAWATALRREVHVAFFAVAHALADELALSGDHLGRLETYRRILLIDEFDQRAHEGLIDSLTQLGSLGQADAARREYEQRMEALGVPL